MLQVQVAENILQDKIVVEVFTEQSSKQSFILIIREKTVIVTRVPSKWKLLNCVTRYVQLILAAFWTDHLFYITLLVLTVVEIMAPSPAELWKWSRYSFIRLDCSSEQEKHLAQAVSTQCAQNNISVWAPTARAPVPGNELQQCQPFPWDLPGPSPHSAFTVPFLQHSEQGRTSACSAFFWTFNLIFYAFCWYNREPKYKKHLYFYSV